MRWSRHAAGLLMLVLPLLALAGCGLHALHQGVPVETPLITVPENPIFVPVVDRDFAWNQIVDTVDDYFRIEREQRVREIDGVLTEGRIDTFPETGATALEPWRRDSASHFDRWHATLQSIRRRAVVRVLPDAGGYLVEVAVFQELEDVDRPELANAGAAIRRHDGTLIRIEDRLDTGPITLGWIPQGRDVMLEQRILSEIRGRMIETPQPRHGWFHWLHPPVTSRPKAIH